MKIRREQLDAFSELKRRERRAVLASQLAADDDRAAIDPETGDVLLEDARGNISRIEISEQGIVGIRSAEDRYYRIEHDEGGRPVRITDPTDETFEVKYAEGGPIQEIRSGGVSLLRCDYSKEYEAVDATFAGGAVERLEYLGDHLVRTVDANGGENRLLRDSSFRITELVDPRGHSTRFEYDDSDGTPLRTVWADGTEETYEEGDDGSFVVKLNGQTQSRVTTDESETEEWANFADGGHLSIRWDDDRPAEAKNEHTEVAFEYDGGGRLVLDKQGENEIGCTYDDDGDLVSLKTAADDELRFDYDGDNLLIGVTDWDGRRFTIERHPSGGISRIAFPNGVTTRTAISNQGYTAILTQSPAVPEKPIVDERYEYDARCRVAIRHSASEARRYAYDPGGRLLEERNVATGASEGFEYDPAGNRVRAGLAPASFDERNRLLTAGAERFTHDAQGNLVARSGSRNESYRYNGQGHLIEVSRAGGEKIEFAYDPFGRRIRKRCGDTTTHFVWAGRQLVGEWTTHEGAVVERRDYVFLPGEHYPLAVRIDGRPFYYHNDRLGTPLAVTDERGKVVWRADYTAFGEARVLVEEINQPLRFAGQYHDTETRLHYNVFRYYDPTLGRYITPDPIRYQAGSTNFYDYAGNDPVNRRDPEGHIVFCTALAIIGAAALVGGLIGGGIAAATAEEGKRGEAFVSGFGWGALGGAVGAAVPIIGAAAGLGAAAIAGVALVADAAVAGVEACSEGGWDVATFAKGAGIAVAMTVGTLGLSKIPGVRRALGAVGKRLSSVTDTIITGGKRLFRKAALRLRPTRLDDSMIEKILYGELRGNDGKKLVGAHSGNVKNRPDMEVEVLQQNPDGTSNAKVVKATPDGDVSRIKPAESAQTKHTLAPDDWSDEKIIETTIEVGDSPPVGYRPHDGSTKHRKLVDGVEWEVIKDSDGNVRASYPTGGTPTPVGAGTQWDEL